jgi:ABC-type hemin transport system ATPase subunit
LKSEPLTQPIALETAHLSRAVIGKVLTDDINVQVQIGEVVAVVGPSEMEKPGEAKLTVPFTNPETVGRFRISLPRHGTRRQRHDDDC